MQILEEVRRHGVGPFINPKLRFNSEIEQLKGATKMIEEAGRTPGTIFLKTNTKVAIDMLSFYVLRKRV